MSSDTDAVADRFEVVIRAVLCEGLDITEGQIVGMHYTGMYRNAHVWYSTLRPHGGGRSEGYWIVLSAMQLASIIRGVGSDGTLIQTPGDAVRHALGHPATQDALKQLLIEQSALAGPTLSA
jgi:hypothetical protein